ncbi:efflux RND transporter periplasmic adaptor subunit [Mariniblastus fucicola]|uniref:Multidrug resistance protein MdtA n=1 Tax=Mariniblastus fucicola TaxID=980251 RepID=A0A5B9PAV5_9BACT|nr:efflux RND transporter periplasmic adaptor subunit [Mariniblastus fucicola]QEG22100.1 Multidrug resistance protein MdtA precursor [Mariniblastus fucicola]
MNESSDQRTRSGVRWLRIVFNAIVCAAILSGAAYAIVVINRTEPVAEKANSTRKSSALVDTITVNYGTYSPAVSVLGTVRPAQQISLRPRVSGQVVELADAFVPGGMIGKGDLLLRIDPADFENALSISKSELEQAKASMEIEKARQRLAEKELKLLEDSIDGTNRGLVLREPQIASIKAEVSAAEAAVERAQLDLERATIYAPFDSQVLDRSVNVGSQVSPGNDLGQLVGLEQYWVMASVPIRSLRWVELPDEKEIGGSKVTLRNPDAWGPDITREGRVSRLIGTLDEQTRLARVMIIVEDPLGRDNGAPPLILDSLLTTEIQGKAVERVVRLDREYVRDEDTVWAMRDGKLEIQPVTVEYRDSEFAYISDGLVDGDEVVISTLATPAEGIGLKKRGASK